MRKAFYLSVLTAILLAACSKKNDNQAQNKANSVSISGTAYSTVVIGNQTWTSVDYNGPGGENYSNGANDPARGKLYTQAEAQAVTLPAGWRIPSATDFKNFFPLVGAQLVTPEVYLITGNEALAFTSKTGWTTTNGTDSLGFNAVPVGAYTHGGAADSFNGAGVKTLFITSTPYESGGSYNYAFAVYATSMEFTTDFNQPYYRASLRFVKDN